MVWGFLNLKDWHPRLGCRSGKPDVLAECIKEQCHWTLFCHTSGGTQRIHWVNVILRKWWRNKIGLSLTHRSIDGRSGFCRCWKPYSADAGVPWPQTGVWNIHQGEGGWKYSNRLMDKEGQTVVFLLTTKLDAAASKRFFDKPCAAIVNLSLSLMWWLGKSAQFKGLAYLLIRSMRFCG